MLRPRRLPAHCPRSRGARGRDLAGGPLPTLRQQGRALSRLGRRRARALADATAAARTPGPLAERLTAAMVAKTARFFDLLRSSEHAAEFVDENHRLCGEISATFAAKHARLLGRMIADAAASGEIALDTLGASATQIAEFLLDTAEGIKARNRALSSSEAYRCRLGAAVRILLAGLAPARRAPRIRTR